MHSLTGEPAFDSYNMYAPPLTPEGRTEPTVALR